MERRQQRRISSTVSTSGAGYHFANRVQTAFAVLMLAKGFCPCLNPWPITKIGVERRIEYDTDDIIVYTEQPGTNRKAKLEPVHTIAMPPQLNRIQ